MAAEVAHQSITVLAPSGRLSRQRIVNFMFGGCQFILSYAEFVIQFPPATLHALNVIMTGTRLRLLVS